MHSPLMYPLGCKEYFFIIIYLCNLALLFIALVVIHIGYVIILLTSSLLVIYRLGNITRKRSNLV